MKAYPYELYYRMNSYLTAKDWDIQRSPPQKTFKMGSFDFPQ